VVVHTVWVNTSSMAPTRPVGSWGYYGCRVYNQSQVEP